MRTSPPRGRAFTNTFVAVGLAFVVASLTLGCGRKATEADCQLIVDRNVEVTMRAMSNQPDQAAITKKQEELRGEMKEGLKDCVGRRVTEGMMDCVKGAKTQDEINACIR